MAAIAVEAIRPVDQALVKYIRLLNAEKLQLSLLLTRIGHSSGGSGHCSGGSSSGESQRKTMVLDLMTK